MSGPKTANVIGFLDCMCCIWSETQKEERKMHNRTPYKIKNKKLSILNPPNDQNFKDKYNVGNYGYIKIEMCHDKLETTNIDLQRSKQNYLLWSYNCRKSWHCDNIILQVASRRHCVVIWQHMGITFSIFAVHLAFQAVTH